MTIYGIEGGIGTGKTITLVHYLISDLKKGKSIFTNIKINIKSSSINYLTAEMLQTIFDRIKNKSMIMVNSSVFIQEMHNYIDSRMAMSKRNRAISYWIAQSRHTGEGTCDIYYDTQELRQVDVRLRNNTDFIIRPLIIRKRDGKPEMIRLEFNGKLRHRYVKFSTIINVFDVIGKYNTHEVVEF